MILNVLTQNPKFFKDFISSHLKAEDEIHIITSSLNSLQDDINFTYEKPSRVKQLNDLDIFYWTVLVRVSAKSYKEIGFGKGVYCKENQIDCLFEDNEIFIQEVKKQSPLTQTFLIR